MELTGAAVYHVIARGNERKAIFRDDRDREIYLERLSQCRSRFQFQVLGYCLMDNHVHLALERGPVALSRVMLALQSFDRAIQEYTTDPILAPVPFSPPVRRVPIDVVL